MREAGCTSNKDLKKTLPTGCGDLRKPFRKCGATHVCDSARDVTGENERGRGWDQEISSKVCEIAPEVS